MSKNTTKFKKQSNSSTVIPSIMSVGNKKLVARGDWTEQDKINLFEQSQNMRQEVNQLNFDNKTKSSKILQVENSVKKYERMIHQVNTMEYGEITPETLSLLKIEDPTVQIQKNRVKSQKEKLQAKKEEISNIDSIDFKRQNEKEKDNEELFKKCNDINFGIEDRAGCDDVIFQDEVEQLRGVNYEMALACESLTNEHKGIEESLSMNRSLNQELKIKLDKVTGQIYTRKEELMKRNRAQNKRNMEIDSLKEQLGIDSDSENDDVDDDEYEYDQPTFAMRKREKKI